MGGQLDAWVVVDVGGVIVACGVIVLWFNWDDTGMLVLTMLKNNNEQ